MKKRFVRGIATLLLVANFAGGTQVFAMESLPTSPVNMQIEESSVRAEETVMIYKDIDGVTYRRLWSYTYGKWLTDWIRC